MPYISTFTITFIKCLLKGYKILISPLLGPRCRFLPSCSDYAHEAFSTHGFLWGFILTLKRLLRCHPWGKSGYDGVPKSSDLACSKKIKSATRISSILKELIK